jgi:bZIP transcription factor
MSSTSVSSIALDYAVSPLLTVSNQESASALARKRRREILTSQRALNSTLMLISTLPSVIPDMTTSSLREVSSSSSEDDDDDDSRDNHDDRQVKKRSRHGRNEGTCDKDDEEVEEDEGIRTLTTSCNKKQPQRKYDPDVPMSREAAALWRREQRRKRNRESAAASRQRQRDRISELEVEVHDYESRYHEVMSRIQALEEEMHHMTTDDLIDSLPTVSPISTITSSTSFSTSPLSTGKDHGDIDSTVVSDSESEKEPEPTYQSKMISRQA